MKKPKDITKGNWAQKEYQNSNHIDIVSLPEDEIVCELQYFGADKEELTANAKAIAQVPNMIDELIDAYYVLKAQVDSWGERRKQHDMYANMKSIEKVLTDAGAKL